MCESLDIPKFRLTMQTKIILKELLEKDKTPTELKAKSGYIAGNIYSTLNRLLDYGLIERRGKKYSITERGKTCICTTAL